jgi:hypothetical protein
MPAIETYAVRFANGNLTPHLNLNGWPEMTNATEARAGSSSDAAGRILTCTRKAEEKRVENRVELRPPTGAISLANRLFLRATFDLPGAQRHDRDHRDVSPEPWAVSLYLRGGGRGRVESQTITVTCQFHRGYNGVRLNTPSPSALQQNPTDQSIPLDSPLDYARYQPPELVQVVAGLNFLIPMERFFPAPLFTLTHSFCGWGVADHRHNPGSAALSMRDWKGSERKDHRDYSSSLFSTAGDTLLERISFIEAVGISLVTASGIGDISVRARSFSLSFNHSAETPDEPVLPVPTPT